MKVYNDNCICNNDRPRMDMIYVWIISSPDICDNLDRRKICCCDPVQLIIEQKCHRICMERNSRLRHLDRDEG
jgi:hypothetical protein